jgi:DNA (cytosine-5)-methyltransferase 3A
LEGDRSGLFWDYVRLLKDLKPKWFILENVASMPKADRDIITKEMGVEPILINASLVSAQCRKRLFWTNIRVDLPVDRGILLKDILQPDAEVDERMVVNGKAYCLTSSYSKVSPSEAQVNNSIEKKQRTMVKLGHIGNGDAQANRVYSPEGKSVCLSANGGGLGAKTGLYLCGREVIVGDSPLQVLQEGRTELGKKSRKEIKKETGKDSTGRSSEHKAYYGKEGVKANCLTTSLGAEGMIVKNDCIRKLTPIECERLQGLPDDYTSGIAMTNRYKCIGNAFNVDVVAHILHQI